MAKQRYVSTAFWNDAFVLDLEMDEKLLFLYLITNPRTDLCGAYEIALKRIAFDTEISAERVISIIDKFQACEKVWYDGGWIILQNFVKHQTLNPRVVAGIKNSFERCPSWVQDRLLIAYRKLSIAFDWLPQSESQREYEPNPKTKLDVSASGSKTTTKRRTVREVGRDVLAQTEEFYGSY